jgi:hypothetical protein
LAIAATGPLVRTDICAIVIMHAMNLIVHISRALSILGGY